MRFWKPAASLLAASLLLPSPALGQVTVSRHGDENPAVSVTKSIFWGGLGGLILGGATALVAGDNEGEIVKWSFVGGTFAGLALGLWHVTHRPEPRGALLDIDPEGVRAALPALEAARSRDPVTETRNDLTVRIPLVAFSR